jgi:alkanesulfonate monooxygenase SsuD/methylene tetrahydromethanopterin reductase-like flavin-dependent oxidoreductase (luciferase family)
MWAQGIRSHMAFSLSQLSDNLPEDFIVSNVARTCVSDDKEAAREVIRGALDSYMRLPNYQNYFIEAGYEDEVSSARTAIERGDDAGVLQAISDRFLDDVALFGTAAEVREQFEAWVEAGVNHMALNPTSATDAAQAPYEVMDAFA